MSALFEYTVGDVTERIQCCMRLSLIHVFCKRWVRLIRRLVEALSVCCKCWKQDCDDFSSVLVTTVRLEIHFHSLPAPGNAYNIYES
jgi:hypothetical protein